MKDMIGQETRLQALANLIAAEIEAAPPRPKLKLIRASDLPATPVATLDAPTRAIYLRIIRNLSKAYKPCGMHLIVDRALQGKGSMDDLSDAEVMALHRNIHRGLECIRSDVPFEHAGLIDEGDSCAWVA